MLPRWWRLNFLSVEFGIATVAVASFLLWVLLLGGETVVNELLHGNRGVIYGTFASILGSLVGFVITTLALVISLSSTDRMNSLRRSQHYGTLLQVFTSATWVLGLGTILALTALVGDKEDSPVPVLQYAAISGVIFVVFRVLRVLWVLQVVVTFLSGSNGPRTSDQP